MADIVLKNDDQYYFPLVAFDSAGAIVPAPAGDTDTVTSGNPNSIGMEVVGLPSAVTGANGVNYPAGFPSLHCTPLVAESDAANGGGGITVTFTDSAGLTAEQAYTFAVSPDTTPAKVGIDSLNVLTVTQAVPTNPGP